MCEALICVKNLGTSGNLAVDTKQPNVGDVIVICPDGWGWTPYELGQMTNPTWGNHPHLRIAKFPNITMAQAQFMLAPELDQPQNLPNNPSPYLQYRAQFLDQTKIQSLYPNFYAFLLDDLRTNPTITVNATPTQVLAVVSTRPPIPWP